MLKAKAGARSLLAPATDTTGQISFRGSRQVLGSLRSPGKKDSGSSLLLLSGSPSCKVLRTNPTDLQDTTFIPRRTIQKTHGLWNVSLPTTYYLALFLGYHKNLPQPGTVSDLSLLRLACPSPTLTPLLLLGCYCVLRLVSMLSKKPAGYKRAT